MMNECTSESQMVRSRGNARPKRQKQPERISDPLDSFLLAIKCEIDCESLPHYYLNLHSHCTGR